MNPSTPRVERGQRAPVRATPAIVGVLGGMGPLATVDFMRKMLVATPAAVDQEHIPLLVSSIPQVPDRSAAFRGEGKSPVASMICSGRRLVAAGAEVVVIACNTAHLWFDDVRDALGLPMLHLVDAAIDEVLASVATGGKVGLMATDATLASGLYVNRRCDDGRTVNWLLPTEAERRDLLTPGIAAVKAGQLEPGGRLLTAAARALRLRGASAVVLGCTEIPLVVDAAGAGIPVVDATAALARHAVAWALEHAR